MSEKRIYRAHSAEFKSEAVKMVLEKKQRRTEVARNLGISVSLLDTWTRNSRIASGTIPGAKVSAELDRIRSLERELERTRMERDILKKAVVFFAKENP